MKRVCLLLLLLSGCAVGPNFERPPAPEGERYNATPPPAEITSSTGADSQRVQPGKQIPSQWWELFHSRPLNDVLRTHGVAL